MNTFSILGLCLFALQGGSQDAGLSQPIVNEQSRTPAADTTIVIHDVSEIIQKRVPNLTEQQQLEEKLRTYLRHQEEATKQRAAGEKATGSEASKIGVIAGEDSPAPVKAIASPKLIATQDLADIVRRYMQPAFEPDHEQLSAPGEGSLLANLRPEQHKWLSNFLDVQRRASGLIEISCEVLQGPRGVFRDLGLTTSSTVIEDPALVAAFRTKADEHKGVDRMTSPRIAAWNGTKATLSTLDQVAYIEDWKLRIVEPGPQEIAEPTINVVQDGFTASMCATVLDEHTYGLDLSFVSAKIERPMQTRKIRLSTTNDRTVEIGLPVVAKISFETNLVLADGASAVFTTASPDPDKDMAILVTLKHRSL